MSRDNFKKKAQSLVAIAWTGVKLFNILARKVGRGASKALSGPTRIKGEFM